MTPATPRGDAPRLVDLAVEWPLQYAGESTIIDPSGYPGLADRLGQVDGYLSATVRSPSGGARPADHPPGSRPPPLGGSASGSGRWVDGPRPTG